jgi:Fic family protein
MAGRIMAMADAHHRFNYIHPFPDGNGRVGRLLNYAMAHYAGIAAHGLWSISRGLACGLKSRGEYKEMMDHADMPRQGELDGRGSLSRRALTEFILRILKVSIDQSRLCPAFSTLKRSLEDCASWWSETIRLNPKPPAYWRKPLCAANSSEARSHA